MGVTRRWLTWVLVGGLAAFFFGERVFHDFLTLRAPVSILGALAVTVATVLRVVAWRRATGESRRIERLFALTYIGCAVSLVGFVVGTQEGVRFLGLEFDDAAWEVRFRRAFLVGSSILFASSALPALAAQWAVREGEGAPLAVLPVQSRRIFEMATSALSVALAGAFLMLAGYLASVHNRTLDASYFKTSTPGTAVQEIVRSMGEPLRAILFFPELNEVGDEVLGYFSALEEATGNVVVEQHDRLAEPWAAEEHDVRSDGIVILASGDRRERLGLPTELDQALARLRVFDSEAQGALMRLARERRIAYLTVGHGELNDPVSAGLGAGAQPADTARGLEALRTLLGVLNYQPRDLGLQHGLGVRVPDDAGMVLVVGPRRAFLPEELASIAEYLDRGGALLLALEPGSEFELGELAGRVGFELRPETLADEQNHVRRVGGPADRQLIVTDRFSAHPAVTTASRQGVGAGILLMGAGYLEPPAEEVDVTPRYIIGSLRTTFADLNGNLTFDPDSETRGSYDLAVAVEGPAEGERAGMRVLAYADADMFSDAVLVNVPLNAVVVADGIRWLGEEEELAGGTTSEEDIPIVHTRAEDAAWFYSIILGAPALVLAIGLFNGSLRRRRRKVAA